MYPLKFNPELVRGDIDRKLDPVREAGYIAEHLAPVPGAIIDRLKIEQARPAKAAIANSELTPRPTTAIAGVRTWQRMLTESKRSSSVGACLGRRGRLVQIPLTTELDARGADFCRGIKAAFLLRAFDPPNLIPPGVDSNFVD